MLLDFWKSVLISETNIKKKVAEKIRCVCIFLLDSVGTYHNHCRNLRVSQNALYRSVNKNFSSHKCGYFFFFFSTTSHRLAFDHCQMEVQIQNYLHHRSDSSLSIKRALSLFLNFLSFVDSSCSLKKLSSILHSVCVFLRSLHIFY